MSRRRLVVAVSAGVLVALTLLAAGGVWVGTQSAWGQEQIRKFVEQQFASAIHGKLYLGHISGGLVTGVTVDSIEIRDSEDTLFVSAGRVTWGWDLRDLFDKRILLRNVEVDHPTVYLRQHENWDWNYRRVFRSGPRRTPQVPGRSFGDFVVMDSVRVRDATFVLTLPWHPDDSLHGARRDSAIAAEVGRKDKEIRRSREGFTRTWRWTNGYAVLPHLHIVDPDTAGRLFAIDTLNVDEREPPFLVRNVKGILRNLGDSIWIDVPHFDLPGSTGRSLGKIWWGSGLPTRYALRVWGDSVSLSDVAWVYPTLPSKGSGSVVLDIANERDLNLIDYKLTAMDVQTTRSRVRGSMTFGTGAAVLIVKDVKVEAAPVDFDLIRTFNGKAFPVDWQGQLTGTVNASGGALTHFVVDAAQLQFHDAHVPGAVSSASGHGELNIFNPAFTAFHNFDVAAQSVDLRTIEYLFPNFPHLGGTLAGTTTLDSVWTDVRFADANLVYNDGDAPVSHVTGNGRVTDGDQFMTYDVTLRADSLSLTALQRSYPALPFTGSVAGPFRAQGTTDDLLLNTSLSGAAGTLAFDGHIDLYPPSYGARGSGHFIGLDPATLMDQPKSFQGSLDGNYVVDLRWDSLPTLQGSASVSVDPSTLSGVHVFDGRVHSRFIEGKLHVDTLRLETSAGTLTAMGALGLGARTNDSLTYDIIVDSLGGLRPFLASRTAPLGGPPDSLAGTLAVHGVVAGNFDSLDVGGRVTGSGIYFDKDGATSLNGSFALNNLLALDSLRGTVALEGESLQFLGIDIDTVGASVRLTDLKHGTFQLSALSRNGPTLTAQGQLSLATAIKDVRVDTLAVHIGSNAWRLASSANIRVGGLDSTLLAIDSIVLRNDRGGAIRFGGVAPATEPVSMALRADSVPVADLDTLLQLTTSISGWASMRADLSGTRERPQITADATLNGLQYAGVGVERVTGKAMYDRQRMEASATLYQGTAQTLTATASLPMDLTLFSGRLLPNDSLRGTIRADSADLGIVAAFFPDLTAAKGKVFIGLDLGGRWDHMTLGGRVVTTGSEVKLNDLGITLKGIDADLEVSSTGDTLTVRRLQAWSGKSVKNSVATSGFIAFRNRDNPFFNLRLDAHTFHAMDVRALAQLDISTGAEGLTLLGPQSGATLSGSVTVDQGVIFIPDRDVAKKQLVDLTVGDIDSTDVSARALVPSPPSRLVEHLTLDGVHVTLGDEVSLRSQEANIKLIGSLNVTRAQETPLTGGAAFAHAQRGDSVRYRLALDGVLTAQRGTYTLDLPLVQRDFQVEGGTITFYGSPDLNPRLDISAIYNVRQYNTQDIKVRARLSGFLYPQPSLSLESGETFEISQSDLVSYLCCGAPNFELGANKGGAALAAAQVLLPTAGSVLTRALRQGFGSFVDVQFQAGATDNTGVSSTSPATSFFSGARLGGEKQLSDHLFFSFSAGLCQLDPSAAYDPGKTSFVDQLGGKLQYRISQTLSVEGGREPPASALFCGRDLRGFVATPPQLGLTLIKSWRFR